MTANAEAKLRWLAEVLGVGATEAPPSGKAQKRKDGDDDGTTAAPTTDATALTSKLSSDPDIAKEQKKLNEQIDALEELGLDTTRLKLDRQDQERVLQEAEKITDKSERKAAVKRARKRIEQLEKHAKALAKATNKVMGDTQGAPSDEQKAKIYTKALEDHYNLKIKVPKGMTNTHLDRVFDMLGTVPRDQAKHRKLKKLTYTDAPDAAGGGAYGGAEIEIGDFGDAQGAENYEIDGTTIPANSFDVTTLHEMGHALDDKKKIMDKHQSKAGCGGWKKESKGSVADAMLALFESTVTLSDAKITKAVIRGAILQGLGSGTPDAPSGADAGEWQKVIEFLADYPAKIIESANPWFKEPVDVDGRVYVESYSNDWWSYATAARVPTKVNKYQWRSPAEWFAEVYAISWLAKKKPPSGVEKAVAEFMWKP